MTQENKQYRFKQQERESLIARPFKQIAYAFAPEKVVLNQEQYCHLVDTHSGKTELVQGPTKRRLGYDDRIVDGIEAKVIIPENHFAVVKNPFSNGRVQYGEREVRQGPKTFALHPGERLDGRVQQEYVLTQYDALKVECTSDDEVHQAGELFLVKGPKTFIPSKDERVLKTQKAFTLSDTDGKYVQNQDTGDVTLVKGPVDYFLAPNEKLYSKELTNDELQALGLKAQRSHEGVRVLTRQAANTSFLDDPSEALVLELEDKEVVLLYDGSETRIETGPQTVFVGPYERPKVLTLSGGKPIKQGALKVALLKQGPDFIYDQIKVRTKDNAQLDLDVTYKWKFNCTDDLTKAFSIDDFVGYSAESLSSDIRSVVAKYDFEDFHANAIKYVKEAIFGEEDSRTFEENGLEIFGIDITSIVPDDAKIAEKLHEAIKSNMDIYCKKLVLKATLEAERQEVEGKKAIEGERAELIKAELANYEARITKKAHIKASRARIRAESEAESLRIVNEAELETEHKRLETLISALNHDGAKNYLELKRAETFKDAEKLVIVPTDSKIVLPYARTPEE